MFLTAAKYNSSEKEGKRYLPNRFLEAFQPITFDKVGYPSRIENEVEVYRYLDSMYDLRLKEYYKSEECDYAPTEEEFTVMKGVAEKIYQFSKEKYNRGIVVKAPMLNSMNVLRRIKCLTDRNSENFPTIFEMGGGFRVIRGVSA